MSEVLARLARMAFLPDPLPDTATAPLPGWARALTAFDTETTGVSTARSRIVSASLVTVDELGRVVSAREWLVDPGVEIPWGAQRVHGISTDRVRAEGTPAEQAIPEIAAAVDDVIAAGGPLVVYNAPYDLNLLSAERERYGLEPLVNPSPIVDPFVVDKAVDRFRKGKRTLSATTAHYGVRLDAAHSADADALAAALVAQAVARAHPEQLGLEAEQLHSQQVLWAREQADSYTEYRRRRGDASFRAAGTWPM